MLTDIVSQEPSGRVTYGKAAPIVVSSSSVFLAMRSSATVMWGATLSDIAGVFRYLSVQRIFDGRCDLELEEAGLKPSPLRRAGRRTNHGGGRHRKVGHAHKLPCAIWSPEMRNNCAVFRRQPHCLRTGNQGLADH